jgi:hypothetical protein
MMTAMRSASCTPRRWMPTRIRSSVPEKSSTISSAMRRSVRAMDRASSTTVGFPDIVAPNIASSTGILNPWLAGYQSARSPSALGAGFSAFGSGRCGRMSITFGSK